MKKPTVFIIFLIVFIDLIGFGIVLPLLPIYSRDFGARGWVIGGIMASYSAMQFFFAPVWGRLSDRVGRRPVLLATLAGGALSYVGFALGSGLQGTAALWAFFLSRLFAGMCGANITVAQAYIADITAQENRSKGMGLIGMAFGLGFIFGPALGALSLSYLGITGPGWVAAGFCTLGFLLAVKILPESLKAGGVPAPVRPRMEQWKDAFNRPALGLLIGIFFLATFGFTCFETTIGLLIGDNFHLDRRNSQDARLIGYLFAYCGVIGALIQGGAIGRLVKRFGEPKLITASLLIFAASMAPLPFIRGQGPGVWCLLLLTLAFLAMGSSLTRPPVFGMISILTPSHEQGAIIGVAQSVGSLARIFGPIFAGVCYEFDPAVLYGVCSAAALLAAAMAWSCLLKVEVARAV